VRGVVDMLALGFPDCFIAAGEFSLGKKVKVSQRKVNGSVQKLAVEFKKDIFLTTYILPNIVEYKTDSKFVSLSYRGKIPVVTSGMRGGGILALSSSYSFNGVHTGDVKLVCSKAYENVIKDRVKIIALGSKETVLLGVFVVPSSKGIYVEYEDCVYSSVTGRVVKLKGSSYTKVSLEDWFQGGFVKEVS